jgi:hypothetical protein
MNRREMLKSAVSALPLIALPTLMNGEATAAAPRIQGVGVIRYPTRMYDTNCYIVAKDINALRHARDLAREMAENIRCGSIIGLPSDRDELDNYLWDFKIEGGDPGQVIVKRVGE